ncbi:MAG: autotransporter domain-containing protein [Xanthobacteraceae bacterium]
MAGVCLGAVSAHAVDGTWEFAPADGNWNNGANWSSNPVVPDGIARFETSNQTSITFSSSTSIQRMDFALGSGSTYSFALPSTVLTVGGSGNFQGININVESPGPTFTQSGDGGLVFRGNATASDTFSQSSITKTGTNILNNGTGFTHFTQSSTAGFAFIGNATGGSTVFTDKSNAGSALIVNINTFASIGGFSGPSGVTEFQEGSDAREANIQNLNGGATNFRNSSANSAHIVNSRTDPAFLGGQLNFYENSSASSAIITNDSGGITRFFEMSNASLAQITNTGLFSQTNFYGSSKAEGNASVGVLPTITNNAGGQTNFYQGSSAGNAVIINNNGGQTSFFDQSSARHATIINNDGGATDFFDNSSAGTATISTACGGQLTFHSPTTAEGATILTEACPSIKGPQKNALIIFKDQSTGGQAQFIINAGGVLDISGLTTAGMTAGSIEGAGTFFLGSKSFTVGGSNLSTEVSGVISDGGVSGGKGGSLIKVGSGTLILSGANTYTGATTLNTGALIVNGSIAASSGLDVNAGTLLGGVGTLPTTRINAGGTLSPGNSIGTIAVAGNLSFAPGSFYVVEVSPTSSDRTVVNDTATVAGTVQSSFRPGGFQKSYTILSAAGGVSGTFDALTTSGLPTFVTANLAYTPNLVSLNLTLGLSLLPGLNGNQAKVAAGIENSFNAGNAITGGFATLLALPPPSLPAALTQLSGEAATGAQQTAFRLSDQFLGLMLDPFVDGRNGTGGADRPALGFAPEREALPDDIALAYAKVLKAAPMKAPSFEQRWTAWGGAFGGGSRVSGDPAVVGSHDLSATTAGFAGGLDYHLSRDRVVGFALAGGGTNWGLAQGLGGGKSDAFQAGVYGATRWGPAYLAAAFDFTNHWMSTDRVAFAGDHLTASFNAQSLGGRVESGYRFGVALGGVTPYAAIQAQSFRTPSYSETDTNGGGFALAFNGRTATDTRSELGARFDRLLAFSPTAVLTLRSRLAWAHDWVSDPALAAVFQTLPGSSFIVNGAAPAKNSALASAGAELRLVNGVSLLGKFDGEFASRASTYAGTGTLRYMW